MGAKAVVVSEEGEFKGGAVMMWKAAGRSETWSWTQPASGRQNGWVRLIGATDQTQTQGLLGASGDQASMHVMQ